MLDCGTVNVKYCEIYYECLNGNLFRECDCTNIRVRNCIFVKQRFLVKSSFQFFWGEVKTESLIQFTKRTEKTRIMKRQLLAFYFFAELEKPLAYNSFDHIP